MFVLYCSFGSSSTFFITPHPILSLPESPRGSISHYYVHQTQELWMNTPHSSLQTHTHIFIITHMHKGHAVISHACKQILFLIGTHAENTE